MLDLLIAAVMAFFMGTTPQPTSVVDYATGDACLRAGNVVVTVFSGPSVEEMVAENFCLTVPPSAK